MRRPPPRPSPRSPSPPTRARTTAYALGDTIEVGLTFSEAVTVTGAPYLLIDVGGTNRRADYNSGTGATQLKFQYTVLAGDDDNDGIAVVANSLTLNGGSIVATDDSVRLPPLTTPP